MLINNFTIVFGFFLNNPLLQPSRKEQIKNY